jgi:hypothetical protein
MKKIIFLFILIFNQVTASELNKLIESTLEYFINQDNIINEEMNPKLFILNLRSNLLELGYNVPTIKELIIQVDELTGSKIVGKKLMYLFNQNHNNDFFSFCNCLCCEGTLNDSNSDDEFDWGNAYIGGAQILAGALLLIIPFLPAKFGGTFLIENGLTRIFDDLSEKGKQNGKNKLQNLLDLIYE